jgi:2,4-dienoyl-CoA reductase-like NADH-dependent reductase (Old Yellow Enzyme family)
LSQLVGAESQPKDRDVTDPQQPLSFARGPKMRNRFMLAPLTNLQSRPDGVLSDDEFRWLTMRAEGGFGLTMTCAASVRFSGLGFPGQLGVYSDAHLPGLTRLATAINATGSLSSIQLHHAGRRSQKAMIGEAPQCAWEDAETGARALSTGEVEQVVEDFVEAGLRAQKAGFHGVEIHGAHGYLVGQFLDAENNRRTDKYGGNPENRARMLFEIIDGLRARTRPEFQLGVRLSPERFGIDFAEARALAGRLMTSGKIDYLDMSLWDVFKAPEEEAYRGKPLIEWFAELDRGATRLGVAGKIMSAADVARSLQHGVDFVVIGRGAILHHDFPRRVAADPAFEPIGRPVTSDYLRREGLGEPFVNYMRTWKGFVAEDEPEAAKVKENV